MAEPTGQILHLRFLLRERSVGLLRARRQFHFPLLRLAQASTPRLANLDLPGEFRLERRFRARRVGGVPPRARERLLHPRQLLLRQLVIDHSLLHHSKLLRLHLLIALELSHHLPRAASLLE